MIAPASTGRLVTSKTAVTAIAHNMSGRRSRETSLVVREQIIVDKKLILPRIEEIPARCKLKIARSTEMPEWYLESERGG